MAFIKAHFNSYIGMNALFFVRNSFKKDTLQKMYDGLSAEHKESIYGQRIKNYLIVGDALKNGDKYSDFEAMDTSGKKHKLSDFTGKYVLLDFTQTYCEPCIESVDELKKADSLYKNKLQLISFNADKSKERWLTGILRDKPTWIALWDGEGIYGKTILKYNVTGYPTFVLLNPEGKIIWKEFGFETGIIEKALEKNVQ
jgi:thiol-disulfide isomerase/thioredoxin